jgi:release factor glutamine methyltransferase
MTTIHSRVAAARDQLRAAGISSDEARIDARLLAEHVLGWTTERYFCRLGRTAASRLRRSIRCSRGSPHRARAYAYIVGHQEFWGLEIAVSPAVLIPRPETELIVEAATELIAPDSQAAVADVGTGSGCLAIAIARERPSVTIVATDVSSDALEIARRNAERLDVAGRIAFRCTDLLAGVDDRFDVIVSNPPYVRDRDHAGIQPEVRFEPAEALYAGDDGLDLVRGLILQATARLKPGGALIFEFGFWQAHTVDELISDAAGLKMVAVRDDLQGIPRIAIAQKN